MAYTEEIREEGLIEKLVQVNRVAKVVKGRTYFWFHCTHRRWRRQWQGGFRSW
jgi:ribosomal protein S5